MTVYEVPKQKDTVKEITDLDMWGEEIKPQTPEERRKLEEQGQMRLQWDS